MAPPNQVLSLGITSTLRTAGRTAISTSPTLSTTPGLNDRLGHARPLHLRAVGRAEVAHVDAVGRARQLAVVARDRVVGEHEVVVGRLADPQPSRRCAGSCPWRCRT